MVITHRQENLRLHPDSRHEFYQSKDFAHGNVAPDIISQVIGFCRISLDYDVMHLQITKDYQG